MKKPKFLMDQDKPEQSMKSFHKYIWSQLRDYDKRMDECIEKYRLERPEDELFKGWTPLKLEEVIVPIQTLFTRCDLLLRVYECELRWMAQRFGLKDLPAEIQEEQNELNQVCRDMRMAYIDGIGRNVFSAFRRELLLSNIDDGYPKEDMCLNNILSKYFGDVANSQKSFEDDPATQQLVSLLRDVGTLTGQDFSAAALIDALKKSTT